jgi:hypothetical protein
MDVCMAVLQTCPRGHREPRTVYENTITACQVHPSEYLPCSLAGRAVKVEPQLVCVRTSRQTKMVSKQGCPVQRYGAEPPRTCAMP